EVATARRHVRAHLPLVARDLREQRALRRYLATEQRHEAPPLRLRIRGKAEQVQDRRQHVDQPDRRGDSRPRRYPAGRAEDERHAEDGVPEGVAVTLEAVLPELLAVVGEQDDERPPVEAEAIEV